MMLRMRSCSLLVLFVFLVGSSCGIPLDDAPEVVLAEELPQALQPAPTVTTTTLPDAAAEDLVIYLVSPADGSPVLVPVSRQVPDVVNIDLPRASLAQLVNGPTDEEQFEDNLTTFVVASGDAPIQVLDVDRPADGQLVVVLSEPPALEGSDRTTAFAQLVYTVTSQNPDSTVRFKVPDEEGTIDFIVVKTDTEEGDVTRPVGREDFSSLAPLLGPS